MMQRVQTYPRYGYAEREHVSIDMTEVAAVSDMGSYPAAQGACVVTMKSGRQFALSVSREEVQAAWTNAGLGR